MSAVWLQFVFVTSPVWVTLLGVGAWWFWAWRDDRRIQRGYAEEARLRSGLPRHERCGCDECIEWRSKTQNITRLQERA